MGNNPNKDKSGNNYELAPLLICGVKQGLRLKARRHWDRGEAVETPRN